MSRPHSCKLCGLPLKGKKDTALFCNDFHRALWHRMKAGHITSIHVQRLIDSRIKLEEMRKNNRLEREMQ